MPAPKQRRDARQPSAGKQALKKGGNTGGQSIKKEKTKYHKQKFSRERQAGTRHDGGSGGGGVGANRKGGRRVAVDGNTPHHSKSARTKEIDINLAAKVSSDLRSDLANFKTKLSTTDFFGAELNALLRFVPPPFVQQHLPYEVRAFRSYFGKFERGAPNVVHAFLMWYEWASYEANKGKGHGSGAHHSNQTNTGGNKKDKKKVDEEEEEEEDKEDGDAAEESNERKGEFGDGKSSRKRTRAQIALAQKVHERTHVRALLQMCLRHNSSRRREGQRALVNHLNALLADDVDCRSLTSLRETAHHAVPYAISRLLVGMATDDFAMIVLHAHALHLALHDTPLTPAAVIGLLAEDFALDARLTAAKARLDASAAKAASTSTTSATNTHTKEEGDDFVVDPDEINDPTRGERNQRMAAAAFAMAVIVANGENLRPDDARRLAEYLCFTYVEQRATRVLTANTLFTLLRRFPKLWSDASVVSWLSRAFFLHPHLEYYRPEGVQLLLLLSELDSMPSGFPNPVVKAAGMDPLHPSAAEQIANALFRLERVTSVHPMIHPVWDDWFELLVQRCAAGESMRDHLSTMVHNVIAPYRRGNADAPRRALLQRLVARLGQLAVRHDDADTRAEMLEMAGKTVGYGRRVIARPTDVTELRAMPVDALDAKVRDLLRQYRLTRDGDAAASSSRTWVLRELRNCLYVPLRAGVDCPYIDDAAAALLEFGLFPPSPVPRDERIMNRAIYLFAEVFSFTYSAAVSRPRCTAPPLRLISAYLEAEQKERTRYTTGLKHAAFRRARNRIVEALESCATRSVLFYADRDMQVLLTLLFLLLSTDDPSNADAKSLAESTVPDLCQFYLTGTLETLDMLYDVLMALVMRPTAPVHVMPLMTCIRRIATGYMLRFARYVRERATLDLILAPLREAFHTDDRELARQARARGEKTAGDSDSDEEEAEEGDDEEHEDHNEEGKEGGADGNVEGDDSAVSSSSSDSSSAGGEDGEEEEGEDNVDAETATEADSDQTSDEEDEENADRLDEDSQSSTDDDVDDDAHEHSDSDDEGEDEDEDDEEPPTQQYVDALKGMVGNADLEFVYPTDTASKEKGDVVRAIRTAARVGCAMRSPLIVHIFQVLLALCRESVKDTDEVIFNSAVASLELLTMTKNRYFGRFLAPEDLFQLLADIQGYCRKLQRAIAHGERESARQAAAAGRRMARLKDVALRCLHFIAYLAHKNHAGEEVRVTLAEYYKSIFADRGWDDKRRLPAVKRDMHHYRHGFAWALLPAALEKFDEVAGVAGAQRVRVFGSCCRMVEAVLPRLSGLGAALRAAAGGAISAFLKGVALGQLYEMKYTLLYNYLHCLQMVVRYNARVGLDPAFAAAVVAEAVDRDELQLSAASIRLLATTERLLGLTPRARETKAPVPVKLLYQQFEKAGRRERAAFYRKTKRVREKVVRALLAHRNDDPTDAERASKRRRREEMRIEDRVQRQVLRERRTATLTKEEREEKRRRILAAKQERIAKNRERKRRLHEQREHAFQKWREEKLAAAVEAAGVE